MEDQATIWYRINETGETNVVDIPKGKMIGHLKNAIQQQNPSLDVSKITIDQSEQHFKDKKQALPFYTIRNCTQNPTKTIVCKGVCEKGVGIMSF